MNPSEIEIGKIKSILLPNHGLQRLIDFRVASIFSDYLADEISSELGMGGEGQTIARGTSEATAVGASLNKAVGSSDASSTAGAVGLAIVRAVGTANATSNADADAPDLNQIHRNGSGLSWLSFNVTVP